MQFAALSYFSLLLLIPLLLALYVYAFRRKRQALRRFMETAALEKLMPGFSYLYQWAKAFCLLGAIVLLIVALTQPQWGTSREDIGRQGRDLLIMLDVSLSMLAEDSSPNRLEQAKAGIRRLVEQIREQGGHRLGLVAFAGRANLQCPLTLDYHFFLRRLDEVDTETVPRKGSLIGDALRQTLQSFGTLDHAYTDIILISDGDDHGSFPLEAAKMVRAQGVGLYIVGVGDVGEGALIPVGGRSEGAPEGNAGDAREYIRYQDHEVRTRLRQSLLLELARVTDGIYEPAGTGTIELSRLYRDHIADQPRRPIDSIAGERSVHRYQWFVVLAVLLLILEMGLRAYPAREN
jgi:Ca-activated chloride channel family protein